MWITPNPLGTPARESCLFLKACQTTAIGGQKQILKSALYLAGANLLPSLISTGYPHFHTYPQQLKSTVWRGFADRLPKNIGPIVQKRGV
jgi:hypothetical protein